MKALALGLVVFLGTMLEAYVAARLRGAEFSGQMARGRKEWALAYRFAVRSAHWSAGFETILTVWLLVGFENKWLMLPAIPGAWLGQFVDQHRRIRAKQRLSPVPDLEELDE